MRLFLLSAFVAVFTLTNAQNTIIFFNQESEKVQFAASEIEHTLKEKGLGYTIFPISNINKLQANQNSIVLISKSDEIATELIQKAGIINANELKTEGFLVHRAGKNQKTIYVLGYDESGTMYGGLELAEIITTKGLVAVTNQLQNPYMKVRGTKFNIPLDMRTPTYTEPSDAAQKNMDEMWDFDFWKTFIDNLARNRYNLISLWNMHPFPSMVKVPEYPDVALNDVQRSTCKWEEFYSLHGMGFDSPEILKNYEVIKKMTIEEKIDFWRKVMAYGKQRNVNFYIITWNVFVYGTDGKYGITDKVNNPITTDYFRKSIKQMLLTYPDLAGIGLTTGENMYDHSAAEKEDWAYATYGLGVLDALKEQPDRKINFIHRQHESKASEISKIFKDIIQNKNINFLFSFKYAQAHVYSSVNQVAHYEFVKDIKSENYKTLWTLRDDDNFYFRWGAPDFVRDFIKNIPIDVSEGFYYGSDQYVWGKDFLTKDVVGDDLLELEKHWYKWMCWGRLGYNPNMGNDRFEDIIQSRFPAVNAQEMFAAWQSASMIYPLVTGFHWGALDFQWYIEASQSQPVVSRTPLGYHDINNFIGLKTHKGTDNIAIPDYVKAYLSNTELKGTTPLQVADTINKNADAALAWADKQPSGGGKDLRITINDIQTMAWLGKYYAHKIKASTYIALFRETLKKEWQDKGIEELNLSAGYWRHYTTMALSNYKNPLWTNRVGYVDFKKTYQWALYEVISNTGKVKQPSMKPTAGGIILEAENVDSSLIETKVSGYTGNGYIANGEESLTKQFVWKYNAPEAGKYILEFRYTSTREEVYPTPFEVNGKSLAEITFWECGNVGNWVWERVTVDLEKGMNTIGISPRRYILIDHLNVIKE